MGRKISMICFLFVIGLLGHNLEASAEIPNPDFSVPLNNIFKVPISSNSYIDGNKVMITQNKLNQRGSIFSTENNKVNLSENFEAEMYIYLDGGTSAADGITFVMHNDVQRAGNDTGNVGSSLGVYGIFGLFINDFSRMGQLKNSFALEFDTYYNGDSADANLTYNQDYGHIATAFPDQLSSYYNALPLKALKHDNLFYPQAALADGKWHLLKINWEKWDSDNNGQLEYYYDFPGFTPQKVTINRSIFGTDSVYWGFTGSTGGLTENAAVAFKSVPGLVRYESEQNIYDEKGTVVEKTILDSVVTLKYLGDYISGKQDIINGKLLFNLDPGSTYQNNSLLVNGIAVTPIVENNRLTIPVNIGSSAKKLDVEFKVKNDRFTKDSAATIDSTLVADNYVSAKLTNQYQVNVGEPVTSAFFENQKWIIDVVNKQLAPKKIDKDIYTIDLLKINKINTDLTRPFKGQHIPKNISYFKNLELLYLRNTKMSGTLPEELGSLSNMKDLRIFDNSLTGGIPESLGNLNVLQFLILDANNLTGTVPSNLAELKNLHTLYLNQNKLVGLLPTFANKFKILQVGDNQLTYNSNTVPSFLTTAASKGYDNTFIKGLKLAAKPEIQIKNEMINTIKPFDATNEGYFDLKLLNGTFKPLYADHVFTILNEKTKEVLYEGVADKKIAIPYTKGINYRVVLDGAHLNDSSWVIVDSKLVELKFETVPSSMAFSISLGEELQKKVVLIGPLTIYDNRDNGNWQLSMITSELKSDSRKLQGQYNYIDRQGTQKPIIENQKMVIEKGSSESKTGQIPISDNWTEEQGLQYKMNGSNYLGAYKGEVTWVLEDVPSGN
ncbi:hypothetical protein DOK67_0002048 [Enterococcus sp. DIV0212c]|uniref:L-type lectin-domain containing protein n=1 Tax=Enterococcus sp. DIV0212c TaxID=2230867 RepID=UPI001A9BA57C|nr:L-type lectin-domain containing protein [Enterococcus sp. DIV0212c]MBO1354774.1 cell surface protein [Enterococcus sp. DIV0212c]